MMQHLNKWLIGLSTAFISAIPTVQPLVNRACTGSCGSCGVSCAAMPFLLLWLLFVGCFGKLKSLLVVSENVN